LPVVGLLVASLSRDPTRIDSPLIGRPAPPFRLMPLDGGEPLTIESLRGRIVVLNFWATWCVPCVVYEDQLPDVRAFIRDRGASYPMVLDEGGRTAIAYGVYGVPETFFISSSGVVVHKHLGPLTPEQLAQLLVAAASSATGNAS
jgi:cytochrome c biogenesis protein CcmG/thiol:disulfide interchange protein DsbE